MLVDILKQYYTIIEDHLNPINLKTIKRKINKIDNLINSEKEDKVY